MALFSGASDKVDVTGTGYLETRIPAMPKDAELRSSVETRSIDITADG